MAPQADTCLLVSTDLVCLATTWFPFSHCHLHPELIPCVRVCSWSLSYTMLPQRLLRRASAPAIPGGFSGQATAPQSKQTYKAVPTSWMLVLGKFRTKEQEHRSCCKEPTQWQETHWPLTFPQVSALGQKTEPEHLRKSSNECGLTARRQKDQLSGSTVHAGHCLVMKRPIKKKLELSPYRRMQHAPAGEFARPSCSSVPTSALGESRPTTFKADVIPPMAKLLLVYMIYVFIFSIPLTNCQDPPSSDQQTFRNTHI